MTDNSQKKAERFYASRDETFYAACEDGHALWLGSDRSTFAAAQADARAHDRDIHGGEPHAVVLSY